MKLHVIKILCVELARKFVSGRDDDDLLYFYSMSDVKLSRYILVKKLFLKSPSPPILHIFIKIIQ